MELRCNVTGLLIFGGSSPLLSHKKIIKDLVD